MRMRSLGRRKRPVWVSVLLCAAALAVWYGQRQGWIGSGSAQRTGSTAASKPSSSASSKSAPVNEPAPATAAERAALPAVPATQIDDLFAQHRDQVWVEGSAEVTKVLADDDEAPRHQRFLAETSDGHSILLAHNIDLAERAPVKVGEEIEFRGEFVWTEQGGKVHFTHRPQHGGFAGGWLKVDGRVYE